MPELPEDARMETLKFGGHPPAPLAPVTVSMFAVKGAFATSDAHSLSGLHCGWYALQKDPEGDQAPIVNNNPGVRCWWQARPTRDIALQANDRGIPYIGQAENEEELLDCLEIGHLLTVPHALVGNPRMWMASGLGQDAANQGWDGISEWYWNAHPWEQPDGGAYPRFVNVCFGIYSEGDPGGQGYVPQSKTVADYRGVWQGPFSLWKSEAMTDIDRQAFNA